MFPVQLDKGKKTQENIMIKTKKNKKKKKTKRYDHFQGYSTDNQCKLLKYSCCYDPFKTLLLITALFYSRKYSM